MDYFTEAQLAEVVRKLLALTQAGNLAWRAVANSKYRFSVAVGQTIFVIQSRDEDDLAPHIIEIHQRVEDGKTRRLQDADSGEFSQAVAEDARALYELVKREVFQIDVIAKNVLADLDKLAEGE